MDFLDGKRLALRTGCFPRQDNRPSYLRPEYALGSLASCCWEEPPTWWNDSLERRRKRAAWALVTRGIQSEAGQWVWGSCASPRCVA